MSESPKPAASNVASAWAPLRHPLFRALWIANVVSGIGTWMHEVAAGWLMLTLDPTPLMVAMVQGANTLPFFFLALPAGALADIFDRRRYLIAVQCWMLACALLLAVFTLSGAVSAPLLLAATFALGCGGAMTTPAWAAALPEVVPKDELQPAVALNSVGINISRAIGPAVAGALVAAAGPGPAFLLNAVSFLGVIVVLARWKRVPRDSALPAERFVGAMRAGVRYVRQAPQLRATMVRAVAFFLFAIATWSLLPLVAKQAGGDAGTYGVLLACIGAGALAGAFVLPHFRSRLSRDSMVRCATGAYAVAMAVVATRPALSALVPAMLMSGAAWIAVLSSLHVSAQMAAPAWVRARALAIYMVTYAAGMTTGSLLWGAVATRWSVTVALLAAAAGLLAAVALTWRWSLDGPPAAGSGELLTWPEPQTHADVSGDRGPVQVTVEYRIEPGDAAAFVEAAQALRPLRRRDGAMHWALFQDAEDPRRYVETFVVESWAEHVRQHHRSTAADAAVIESVRRYHAGEGPPRVSHVIAVGPG